MKSSGDTHRFAPNAGEPLLTCFDCGRTRTVEQLTLFPWWDERVNEFETMYWCDRCLPRTCKQILKQLAKNEKMLSSFVEFVSKRVRSRQFAAPPDSHGAEALEYARQVLDDLVAHEVFIRKR